TRRPGRRPRCDTTASSFEAPSGRKQKTLLAVDPASENLAFALSVACEFHPPVSGAVERERAVGEIDCDNALVNAQTPAVREHLRQRGELLPVAQAQREACAARCVQPAIQMQD